MPQNIQTEIQEAWEMVTQAFIADKGVKQKQAWDAAEQRKRLASGTLPGISSDSISADEGWEFGRRYTVRLHPAIIQQREQEERAVRER